MLLTKMTGPAHEVETTYEPHRNLITDVVTRAKSSIGILPMARGGTPEPQPAAPSLVNPGSLDRQEGLKPSLQPDALPISSYAYSNDLLGRRGHQVCRNGAAG